MKYEYATLMDAGRVRSNNEDSIACTEGAGVFVLADGMGGYNAGEVASSMTTAFLNAELAQWVKQSGKRASITDVHRALSIYMEAANTSVFNAANSEASYYGMGTTVIAGVFHKEILVLGHVGDSRGYLLRNNVLRQITKDHSMLQEQLDAGLITPEQAQFSLHRNLVTRAVGVLPHVDPEIHEHQVLVNDLFLLCSDGLSDMLGDEEIAHVLRNHNISLQSRAAMLVEAANAAGGRDNIAVVLIQAQHDAASDGWFSRMVKNFT